MESGGNGIPKPRKTRPPEFVQLMRGPLRRGSRWYAMLLDDRDNVERVLAGEVDAFEHLVRKYNRLAGAIAFGITGDVHLAEDVVQEAFLKAYRSLESLRRPERFRPWFSGIVRKQAIDAYRQRRARKTPRVSLDEVDEASAVEPITPESRLLREEQRRRILAAMDSLPSADRLALVLKHMEGLSYREIAEITHTSVSSVESRLFRARRALREKLTHLIRTEPT